MNRQLCVADCQARGQHAPDCPDPAVCFGCIPRLAADGVRLCGWHLDKLGQDPIQLADLYDEIGLRLAGSTSTGEKTSGTKDPGLSLDERAVWVRDDIRGALASWCLMICEERGIRRPYDETHSIAAFVAKHATWLAAHGAAADASSELRELHLRAYPIAYPSGARVFDVAACPMHDCAGTIKAIVRRTDALLPSSLVCDTDEAHQWQADRWLTLGRELKRREAA